MLTKCLLNGEMSEGCKNQLPCESCKRDNQFNLASLNEVIGDSTQWLKSQITTASVFIKIWNKKNTN